MKGSRFSEEQILSALQEHEAGANVADVYRRHSISQQTLYRWKQKYGGLAVSDLRRLKRPEEVNVRLKWLVAEQALDN